MGTRSRPAAEESVLRFEVPIPKGEVVEPAVGRRGMAVSPDGKRIAFTTMGADGLFTLWVRDLSGLDSRPVPAGRGAHTLFWGPDQSALYFSVRGALKKWTSGDAPVQVVQSFPGLLMSGAQLSDGRLLLSGRFESFIVDPAAGRMDKLANSVHFQPQSIPGSDEILFAEYDEKKALWRTRIGRNGSRESVELVEAISHAEYAAGHLLYVLNGSLVARPFDPAARRTTGDPQVLAPKIFNAGTTGAADFSVSDDTLVYRPFVPDSAVTWVDRAGTVLGRLGPAPASMRHVRLSPDGRKAATVLYEVDRGEGDAWVFDVRTGEGRRVTGRPGLAEGVVFSPDGSSIAYARAIGQPPRLRLLRLQEEAPEEILPEAFFQIPTDWSRDGRFLAFTNTAFRGIENEREGNVWLIDMTHGRRVIPLLDSPFHETGLVFSPDGKWVAYLTNDSGRPEAYVHRFEGGDRPRLVGERRLLSRGGALQIRWSGTGREVFYLGMDNRVHAVRVSLDEAQPVVAPPEDLFEISLGARAAAYGDSLFDVSPDGQRFLIPSVLQGAQPGFVVVRNWRRLLED
jgi:Tol biopolymer transport system component